MDGAGGFDQCDLRGRGARARRSDLVVDVGGAVLRPGVYRLPGRCAGRDAIAAAGGYGASADAAQVDLQLNLAGRRA